jgi:hypothetical protein
LMLLHLHHHNNIFILLIFLLHIIIHIYSPTLSIDALKTRELTVNVIELTTKYYTASIDIHLLDLLESHGTRSWMAILICMYIVFVYACTCIFMWVCYHYLND